MLHGETLRLTRIYEQLGVKFPPFREFDAREVGGHIVICPPHASGLLSRVPAVRTAAVHRLGDRSGRDLRLPLHGRGFRCPTHADFPDLLKSFELVQPRRVLTLHGFAREFAATLRARGVDALALGQRQSTRVRP